ncbi:class I SAM-dependent methyltransferase [Gammaproteobacteria bacterium AB-CW1]|uniref:Class I SAM-dependent methyltransferase n=1 Tax=Natronospira elongata TaxID=3110268 RepID=A0AAP6JEQ9_9GAMM|nr:class I SAM-dependent methyltransferase [Gammaproteobacteria bacterium AB-CW1]
MRQPLTQLAQTLIRPRLQAGDCAVDATVGNGHDTRFLAECVGETGQVLGLDIQEAAIRTTEGRLAQAGLNGRVQLRQCGHERLDQVLPDHMRGRLKVVMFNLGYLPGGDHDIVTRPDTTLTAIRAAWDNLCADGLISLMIYRGHRGGKDEYQAIRQWLDDSALPWSRPDPEAAQRPATAPVLLHLGRG